MQVDWSNNRVACIGKRDISDLWKMRLETVGRFYAEAGITVATGNAPGADQAYARGANGVSPERVELCLPWATFERKCIISAPDDTYGMDVSHLHGGNTVRVVNDHATPEDWRLAEICHPAWGSLGPTVKPLLVRNAMVIRESSLVHALPNYGKLGWGGTGHAIRIAGELGIPVWLCDEDRWWGGLSEGTEQRR